MKDFWCVREGMALRPYGVESGSMLGKLPFGKVVRVEVKQPRNGAHHRLYWTLCTRIGDGLGMDSEDISDVLKIRTGHFREVKTRHGMERFPKSISFAAMDQEAFGRFFDKCVLVITTEWGIARADILECVKDLLDDTPAQRESA